MIKINQLNAELSSNVWWHRCEFIESSLSCSRQPRFRVSWGNIRTGWTGEGMNKNPWNPNLCCWKISILSYSIYIESHFHIQNSQTYHINLVKQINMCVSMYIYIPFICIYIYPIISSLHLVYSELKSPPRSDPPISPGPCPLPSGNFRWPRRVSPPQRA